MRQHSLFSLRYKDWKSLLPFLFGLELAIDAGCGEDPTGRTICPGPHEDRRPQETQIECRLDVRNYVTFVSRRLDQSLSMVECALITCFVATFDAFTRKVIATNRVQVHIYSPLVLDLKGEDVSSFVLWKSA
jgi:hypothetical protein